MSAVTKLWKSAETGEGDELVSGMHIYLACISSLRSTASRMEVVEKMFGETAGPGNVYAELKDKFLHAIVVNIFPVTTQSEMLKKCAGNEKWMNIVNRAVNIFRHMAVNLTWTIENPQQQHLNHDMHVENVCFDKDGAYNGDETDKQGRKPVTKVVIVPLGPVIDTGGAFIKAQVITCVLN